MNDHKPAGSLASPSDLTPEAELSRRRFMRGAMRLAMAVGAGGALSACGGGGGDDAGDAPPPSETASEAFVHGVASGDPLSDRVILWTRVTPSAPGNFSVGWEVASDASFGAILGRGTATTGPAQDYTVKVDVAGLLPATVYHYRFTYGAERSAIGRTKTLPTGSVSQVKLAVLSCANFPAGYFNVYADVAKRGDIDAALHLGDYIYEYGLLGYASQTAFITDRESSPRQEILTLADYRQRHAQYKSDPDLRALHAAMPLIAVWDDHDVADNTWSGGAGNHDASSEGSFAARRAAAVQAWQEWLPVRVPDAANPLKIYRSFDFGTLASLHMLDTRLIGRDEQLKLPDYLEGVGLGEGRQLLGLEQSAWLTAQMTASTATWQVLGQQVLMARMEIPLSIASSFTLETLAEYTLAKSTPEPLRSDAQRALVDQRRAPYNLDAWDGYPAARESVLATARSLDKNLISLAGDTHNAWASDLTDAAGSPVGVEFATASVSSPGFERVLPLISSAVLEDAFPDMVPDLRYAECSHRGYVVLTLTPSEARGEWVQIDTVWSRDYQARTVKTLRTLPGGSNRKILDA
ncbi:alkaline phosphatase [Pseudorhodoferax sp. Leaf267]|uniref:alkaline phosphatase D family protein n=1 Tax=Pseudorhodoferax sp. Leaf267 TaxID=1736316 RepID=UPI0006F73DBD|nr:alkaline phosphatase D family protein [Pseudorhodoferax sp. Leaf267]KQP18178.1 alkaline phosphatase [Pseudorhodoferax sp. Leaf267]